MMSVMKDQDRMVLPSDVPPSCGGPVGGGVPAQTDSPNNGVSGRGESHLSFPSPSWRGPVGGGVPAETDAPRTGVSGGWVKDSFGFGLGQDWGLGPM